MKLLLIALGLSFGIAMSADAAPPTKAGVVGGGHPHHDQMMKRHDAKIQQRRDRNQAPKKRG